MKPEAATPNSIDAAGAGFWKSQRRDYGLLGS